MEPNQLNQEVTLLEFIMNNKNKEFFLKRLKSQLLNHYEQQNHDLVLKCFKSIFNIEGFNTPFNYFSFARASFNVLKTDNLYINYWANLSSPYMTYASDLAEVLISKNFSRNDVITDFSYLVYNLSDNSNVQKNLIDSFTMLVDAVLNAPIQTKFDESVASHDLNLVTSGIGWSGSGAITDYLREYSNIETILGEVGIIEEDVGFAYFVRNIENKELIFTHAIKFFFINLLGCYDVKDLSFYKPIRSAYILIKKSKNIENYSRMIKSVSSTLSDIIRASCSESYSIDYIESLLHTLGPKLLTLVTLDVSHDKIPLIDNCIHIHKIDLLNYFTNIKIICSNRDPRSIYVTRIEECPGFGHNADSFSRQQRKVRQIIDLRLKKLNPNVLKNVYFVNFEDFVISKQYRENLALNLGLNLNNWEQAELYFKPNESIKNVNNFTNLQDESLIKDIQVIESELKDYCLDIK